jgi:hypothetical protein
MKLNKLKGPLVLGGAMIAFLCLIVLITKGPIAAIEMAAIGALVIAGAVWYDSL